MKKNDKCVFKLTNRAYFALEELGNDKNSHKCRFNKSTVTLADW